MSVSVVIASYLEPSLVQRVEASADDLVVHYRPDLLPAPRYAGDHSAPARDLTSSQLREWRDLVAIADVMFDFDWDDPSTLARRSPQLRWIQATSAGIGALMRRTGLDQSSIVVTTAAGIHAVPLAEFAVLGALYFVKGVPQLRRRQREHHWERYAGRQLRGSRALVVGLGSVGREIAQRLADLGVEVVGLGRVGRRYDVPCLSEVIDGSRLDATLPGIDLLVLACPLTDETEGMIAAAQLALMKPDAVLVNVARGPVVDEDALVEALRDNRLAGACLDVFREEPLAATSPLWDMDNVIVSPHSASTVSSENADLVDLFLDNLARWRRGDPLRNLYDRGEGY